MSLPADSLPMIDAVAFFEQAKMQGRTGYARKVSLVDARPARSGEVVETVIAGEGPETHSGPANDGDMVVRNRSALSGNEAYLVAGRTFSEKYEISEEAGTPREPGGEGWRAYRPRADAMRYMIVTDADGAFSFTAPWGEMMPAYPGDAILQDPSNPSDTYRVASAAFAATYEIENAPPGAERS